ncbi:MAG: lytic transglycosylase domain-containing protein [Oscillospiraceae bacterium]|nr:lytic transglycosylase domain-containing protein [Oscillospiraceae bacterium]
MTIEPIGAQASEQNTAATAPQAASVEQSQFSNVLSNTTTSSGYVDLDAIFDAAAQRYNLPVNLLKAVAQTESNFQINATSPAGAMGIMQLMPATARGLGVTDAYEPEQNIMGGAKFLRQMLDTFNGDVQLALAAYNAGPNNVQKYGGIPPFNETQNYVRKVLETLGGGNITAGIAAYNRFDNKKSGGFPFGEAFTQMLLVKIIEMQMNSNKDDDKRIF